MRKTISLVVYASIIYSVAIYYLRGYLLETFPSTIILLAAVLLLSGILYADLHSRARIPTKPIALVPEPRRRLGHEVQILSRQIDVAPSSSPEYYEQVLLERLKQILVEKASIETGIDTEKMKGILEDPIHARTFLRDEPLYQLLYTRIRSKSKERVFMLEQLAKSIGDWKP